MTIPVVARASRAAPTPASRSRERAIGLRPIGRGLQVTRSKDPLPHGPGVLCSTAATAGSRDAQNRPAGPSAFEVPRQPAYAPIGPTPLAPRVNNRRSIRGRFVIRPHHPPTGGDHHPPQGAGRPRADALPLLPPEPTAGLTQRPFCRFAARNQDRCTSGNPYMFITCTYSGLTYALPWVAS